jgi:hypothetical protein
VVVSLLFFLFEKEKCRRRDGHQSPENEPGLLYNLRVCVCLCVCTLLLLLVSGEWWAFFFFGAFRNKKKTHTHSNIIFWLVGDMFNNKVCRFSFRWTRPRFSLFFFYFFSCGGTFFLGCDVILLRIADARTHDLWCLRYLYTPSRIKKGQKKRGLWLNSNRSCFPLSHSFLENLWFSLV